MPKIQPILPKIDYFCYYKNTMQLQKNNFDTRLDENVTTVQILVNTKCDFSIQSMDAFFWCCKEKNLSRLKIDRWSDKQYPFTCEIKIGDFWAAKKLKNELKLSRNWAQTELKLNSNWAEAELKLSSNWVKTELGPNLDESSLKQD